MDRAEVKEALAYWDQIERTEPRRVSLTWGQLDGLLAAARLWVDQGEGQEVYWCTAHLSRMEGPHEPETCQFAQLYSTAAPYCRMVRRLLVDPEEKP